MKKLAKVCAVMERAITRGVFPGASVLAFKDGEAAHRSFHGVHGGGIERPVDERSVYDIASLTKVMAATAACMLLDSEGSFDPETPVTKRVLSFSMGDRSSVTVSHLLSHRSGLPAWRPFYESIDIKDWGRPASRTYIRAKAASEPLEARPGEKHIYSDLGFIVLDEFLESLTGEPLDAFLERRLFGPLGMERTFFIRYPGGRVHNGLVTPPVTGGLVGAVDDENCRAMGGVSGHAGLYSTVDDLFILMREFERGFEGRSACFDRKVVERYWKRPEGSAAGDHALGWDTRAAVGPSSGALFSESTVGHLGFTGCSAWYDPKVRLGTILLSNRVCPTRDNDKIKKFRPLLHDAVFKALCTGRNRLYCAP